MKTTITNMKYHRVSGLYEFWHVQYELNNFAWHKMYKSAWEFDDLGMEPPEALPYFLRAELQCTPVHQRDRVIGADGKEIKSE